MLKIAIRADGGRKIGLGHIMRCLSLAKEFRNKGHEVFFISKYIEGINKINEAGFDIKEISTCSILEEPNEIKEILKNDSLDLIIIDSYDVDERYLLQLKSFSKKIAYIDDINLFKYPVDILINGNITGKYLNYEKYSEDEVFLLGTEYNMVRDEFKDLPKRVINDEVKEIMLTTGGTDPFNISGLILDLIEGDPFFKNIRINLVIGTSFENRELLINKAKNNNNIYIYENIKKISEIMIRSDVAISASGSTIYELCAAGTPTLSFIMVDNQELIASKMEELGYLINAGWYYCLKEERFIELLRLLFNNSNLRKTMSIKGQKFVNGEGTKKIVKFIEELLNSQRIL